jgi:hypothetical protein
MITIRTTPDMNEKLIAIAQAECRTKSEQIEFYIQEGLDRDVMIDGLGMSARQISIYEMEQTIMRNQARMAHESDKLQEDA